MLAFCILKIPSNVRISRQIAKSQQSDQENILDFFTFFENEVVYMNTINVYTALCIIKNYIVLTFNHMRR